MHFQVPKGTFDVLPYGAEEKWRLSSLWIRVETLLREVASDYGYQEIRTPIYEQAELFDRGVGETSDIVSKEMFTFLDKGGRQLALRPEGTSSVMRAFMEHGLAQKGGLHRFFYLGPMFRYERPQSGRYRQHTQFGVEVIGGKGAELDAEVIDLLFQVYQRLGLKNLTVHLNSVGDPPSRASYREALLGYLRPYFQDLSSDSQVRFEKNPLRILDSKDPKDKEILQGAPSLSAHLTTEAKEHFEQVQERLASIGIPFVVNDKIVRGLDYYNKTVFEVLSTDLKAQNTMGAGGRYDGLLKQLGGADLPSVGFATGLERVLQALVQLYPEVSPEKGPVAYFIPMGDEALGKCFTLATLCRREGISAGIELQAKKLQAALQNGSKERARFFILIGSEEIEKRTVQVKHAETREQEEIAEEKLFHYLRGYR